MEFHRPLLPNGQIAPIPWEIRLFFLNVSWPAKVGANLCSRIYDKTMLIVGFLILCYMNEAEVHYMIDNIADIGATLEGMATYLILVEMHVRVYSKAFFKESFREFINEFYQKIYLERSFNKQTYLDIQRKLLPTRMVSYFYILTLFSYLAIPTIGFFNDSHLLPFKATFHYDLRNWSVYAPTLIISLWTGVAVVSQLSAESNLLAMLILHLNARYLHLQRDLDGLHAKLSRDTKLSKENVLTEYRKAFISIIKRNIEYNDFAQKFQNQYSLCIFVMMAFSAVLLCVLGFKAATLGMSSKNVTYISWIIAKIVELLVFGTLGSQLIDTTNNISTCYYMSNWEHIIMNSENTIENVELMKLIMLATEMNQKPFSLTGFNYFSVSLATVVTILQGAGSYFTFLYAFR